MYGIVIEGSKTLTISVQPISKNWEFTFADGEDNVQLFVTPLGAENRNGMR